MTEEQVIALTRAVLVHHRPEGLLFGELDVRFGRSLRALGLAHYPSKPGHAAGDRPWITYSRPLFSVMPEHEQRDTVIHEVAHLLTSDDWQRRRAALGPDDPRRGAVPKGHGLEWQTWMIKMGGKPRAKCSDAQLNEAARALVTEQCLSRDGVRLVCRCREHVISLRKAAGRPLVCRSCHGALGPASRTEALAMNLYRAATGVVVPSFGDDLDKKAKGLRQWTTTTAGRGKIVALAKELVGV